MKKLLFTTALIACCLTSLLSQPCLPEGITFTTQTQIDSFQINYPGCTEIEGDVEISGDNITNLNGLSVLTSIGGVLGIGYTDSLINLIGLDNVSSIGGDLAFNNNNSLISLTGMGSITQLEGDLVFFFNQNLTDFSGLDNLEIILGDLYIKFHDLNSFSGLNNVDSIMENVTLSGNSLNSNMDGLGDLSFIGGDFILGNNIGCTNLSGLDKLETIEGDFKIIQSFSLIDLTGIPDISTIGGNFVLNENWNLENLIGLNSLTSILGDLCIDGTDYLLTLDGLENLILVGGKVKIGSIGSLYDPAGNYSLINLAGLNYLEATSIDSLIIINNHSLTNCAINSICDYLDLPDDITEIHNNAPGCNSPEEVIEACEEVGTADIIQIPEFSIYPNPATNEIFIATKNRNTIKKVNIYNQVGQRLIHENGSKNMIDVSSLKKGMYVIELVTNDIKVKKKLIIR